MLHPSNSMEQQKSEILILNWLNIHLGTVMQPFSTTLSSGAQIKIDGYDPDNKVACEIYSRVGELKAGHRHKIATDILKLVWFEHQRGEALNQRIICFASDEAARILSSKSWLANAAKDFGVTFLVAQLDANTISNLLLAQQRQVR